MRLCSVAGFGLIQVMVGVAILGIVSLTFARKSFNRQDLGIALQLISYRDQALDYYTALASNRLSWKETRGSNWSSVANNSNITLKDVNGLRRIPSLGLELSWETHITSGNILPSTLQTCKPASGSPAKYTDDHFCLKATKVAPDQLQISIDYRKENHTPAQMGDYLVKPRSRTITFWKDTVGKVCEGKAVAGLNLENKQITCSGYNLINPLRQCESIGGQRAVTGFSVGRPEDLATTNCSGADNVLLVKSSLPSAPTGVSKIQGGVVTPITGYIAVKPHDCVAMSGQFHATQGWDSTGEPAGCVKIEKGPVGERGPRGFEGPIGKKGTERGDRGDQGDQGEPSAPASSAYRGPRGPRGIPKYCCASCPT